MKVSQITNNDLINYMRLNEEDLTDWDKSFLDDLLGIAKIYIKANTSIEDLDEYDDYVIVVYCLVQDMYDNRSLSIDKNSVECNKVIQCILGLHDENLL